MSSWWLWDSGKNNSHPKCVVLFLYNWAFWVTSLVIWISPRGVFLAESFLRIVMQSVATSSINQNKRWSKKNRTIPKNTSQKTRTKSLENHFRFHWQFRQEKWKLALGGGSDRIDLRKLAKPHGKSLLTPKGNPIYTRQFCWYPYVN